MNIGLLGKNPRRDAEAQRKAHSLQIASFCPRICVNFKNFHQEKVRGLRGLTRIFVNKAQIFPRKSVKSADKYCYVNVNVCPNAANPGFDVRGF